MHSPGAPAPSRLPIEDSYLDLLADTLSGLELPARGQFLQRYFHTITQLDLQETQCVQLWDEMLLRRRELSECLHRPVALKTALVDVLASAGMFRVPIIMEYDALKELQLNAVTDALTGLYNRRLFGESFEKELNRARRYGQPLGLVILDLHRFKEVNDTHGHPRGDEVLRTAAATLKNALRTSDSAFRIGGDEFALLLPQTDAPQAMALSRRVEMIFAENLKPLQITVGVNMDHGVANFPQDGEHADQLIRVADERLYRLKHASHGRSSGSSAASRAESTGTRTEVATHEKMHRRSALRRTALKFRRRHLPHLSLSPPLQFRSRSPAGQLRGQYRLVPALLRYRTAWKSQQPRPLPEWRAAKATFPIPLPIFSPSCAKPNASP